MPFHILRRPRANCIVRAHRSREAQSVVARQNKEYSTRTPPLKVSTYVAKQMGMYVWADVLHAALSTSRVPLGRLHAT